LFLLICSKLCYWFLIQYVYLSLKEIVTGTSKLRFLCIIYIFTYYMFISLISKYFLISLIICFWLFGYLGVSYFTCICILLKISFCYCFIISLYCDQYAFWNLSIFLYLLKFILQPAILVSSKDCSMCSREEYTFWRLLDGVLPDVLGPFTSYSYLIYFIQLCFLWNIFLLVLSVLRVEYWSLPWLQLIANFSLCFHQISLCIWSFAVRCIYFIIHASFW
jgi:hypothetical protein